MNDVPQDKFANFKQLPIDAQIVVFYEISESIRMAKRGGDKATKEMSFEESLEKLARDFIENPGKIARATERFWTNYKQKGKSTTASARLNDFKSSHSIPLLPIPEKFTMNPGRSSFVKFTPYR